MATGRIAGTPSSRSRAGAPARRSSQAGATTCEISRWCADKGASLRRLHHLLFSEGRLYSRCEAWSFLSRLKQYIAASSAYPGEAEMASSEEDRLPSYASTTVIATCHCGGITVMAPSPPHSVTECDCSICRRYGVIWAYYRQKDVLITAEAGHSTSNYIRSDPGSSGNAEFYFCSKCGCMTHATLVDTSDPDRRIGLNVRMLDPKVWADAKRKMVKT